MLKPSDTLIKIDSSSTPDPRQPQTNTTANYQKPRIEKRGKLINVTGRISGAS